jgi:hypothetical protein
MSRPLAAPVGHAIVVFGGLNTDLVVGVDASRVRRADTSARTE